MEFDGIFDKVYGLFGKNDCKRGRFVAECHSIPEIIALKVRINEKPIYLLFLGVMYGVGGTTSTVKFVSSRFSKLFSKKLPQQASTKTIYYPLIKKVSGYVSVKLTKIHSQKTFPMSYGKLPSVLS